MKYQLFGKAELLLFTAKDDYRPLSLYYPFAVIKVYIPIPSQKII